MQPGRTQAHGNQRGARFPDCERGLGATAGIEALCEAFRSVERQHHDDLLALDAVSVYFKELYWRLDTRLDREDLLGMLKGAAVDSLPLETLAAKFRVIESAMRPVIVSFDPDTGGLDSFVEGVLRDLEFAPGAARKLQPFIVQLPQKAYDALWRAKAIEPVAPDRYGDQFVQLVNRDLYYVRFGLRWENPTFHHAESLMG